MTYWKASNLAYKIRTRWMDRDLIVGPAFNGYDWDIACWDISKLTRIAFQGGFIIRSKRIY